LLLRRNGFAALIVELLRLRLIVAVLVLDVDIARSNLSQHLVQQPLATLGVQPSNHQP